MHIHRYTSTIKYIARGRHLGPFPSRVGREHDVSPRLGIGHRPRSRALRRGFDEGAHRERACRVRVGVRWQRRRVFGPTRGDEPALWKEARITPHVFRFRHVCDFRFREVSGRILGAAEARGF